MDPPAPATTDPGAATPAAQRSASGPRTRRALLGRLRRIEGQVRGVCKMVEEDRYCVDILTQVSAIQSALNAFNKELLAQHIKSCVVDDIRAGHDEVVDELVATLQKVMK